MTTFLDHWQYHAMKNERVTVLPDGCEDLICSMDSDGAPIWFVSELGDCAYNVEIHRGKIMQGLRFPAGARIKKPALLDSIRTNDNMDDVKKNIGEFVSIDANVEEALAVLKMARNVSDGAKQLSISTRSLQRLLIKHTHKPPSFWLRLGRVRVCANSMVNQPASIAEIAYRMGYTDQAHMNHEFKHWFDIAPQQFRSRIDLIETINASGYGTS